jgi:hypothetical protein
MGENNHSPSSGGHNERTNPKTPPSMVNITHTTKARGILETSKPRSQPTIQKQEVPKNTKLLKTLALLIANDNAKKSKIINQSLVDI